MKIPLLIVWPIVFLNSNKRETTRYMGVCMSVGLCVCVNMYIHKSVHFSSL